MIVYYNPDCSKCREARELLENNQCEITFREYLKSPPTTHELTELLSTLDCKAFDIVRTSEPLYQEKFKDMELSNEEWIAALCENPVLIERPIVIDGARAIVGRPPVRVLELVETKG